MTGFEGVGHEFGRGEVGTIHVPLRYARAADADLTGSTVRNGLEGLVEHVDAVTRQGPADCDGTAGLEFAPGGGDGRFGGAVGVEHAARRPAPALHEVARAGFAAHDERVDGGHVAVERGEQRRHAAQDTNLLLDQEFGEGRTELPAIDGAGDEGGASDEGGPDLFDGEIEGERHSLVDTVVTSDIVDGGAHREEVADVGVRDRHALGPAGGSGRIDDICECVALIRQRSGAWRASRSKRRSHGRGTRPGRAGREGRRQGLKWSGQRPRRRRQP